MMMPGPCCICGGTNYPLSMGGPTICPKCDCGHFDTATVMQQADEIARLRADNERLQTEMELWRARAYAEGFVFAAERGRNNEQSTP